MSSLSSTELDLLIARLILASAVYQVFKGDLLGIRSPCVRKYRIGRDYVVANKVLSEAELATVAALQKPHSFMRSFTGE